MVIQMNLRLSYYVISICISVVASILLIMHLLNPTLPIDSITISLLIIAIIPWAWFIFKSIKLPGGFELNYRDLEEITRKLDATGIMAESGEVVPDFESITIQSLSPILQLANLRIEIEKRLRKLAKMKNIEINRPISQIINNLFGVRALSRGDLEVLRQLFMILNAAIHGEEIAGPVSAWALDEGPRLLAGLDRLIERNTPR